MSPPSSAPHDTAAASPKSPEWTLILPAYNEEPTIAQVLGTVTHSFPEAEIIVVSDGSTDRTPLLAKQHGVRCVHYSPNRGKGYAVRRGVLAATTPLVIFTDADLPFGVEGVRTIVRRLSEDPDAEMVIASKIDIKRGLTYRTARHAARAGIALLTGLRYADTQAGLKGFRLRVAKAIYSRTHIDGFASDIEVLYLAKQDRVKVVVIPMAVAGGVARPSSFGLGQGWRLLKDVWRIRRGR